MKLEDDRMCFACGEKNPNGLQLKFAIDKDDVMKTEFTPQKHHQGFSGIVHGGLIALILDEIMVNLTWKLGKMAVTAEMNVRLKKPAKVGETLYFAGQITKEENRLIYTRAQASKADGTQVALATAKCVKVK